MMVKQRLAQSSIRIDALSAAMQVLIALNLNPHPSSTLCYTTALALTNLAVREAF